ncbi:MAG TPA: hypothetical protein VEA16_00210 [Vicinamibacterales bacterium]|nr:hypothetical protein [Vicinamibacterales bacterium]
MAPPPDDRNEFRNPFSVTSAPVQSLLTVFAVPLLTLVVAAITVDHRPALPYLEHRDVSPRGYTYSLVLFILPTISFFGWLFRNRRIHAHHWQAFWWTAAIVVPLWCLVDIFLGNTFFRFPNPHATLGIFAPGYTFGVGWQRTIPIEEFIFYAFGCASILLAYIWATESWLAEYTMSEDVYLKRAQSATRLFALHWPSLAIAASAFAVALWWKKFGWHPYHDGFPGYFLFELMLVMLPSAALYGSVSHFINRPAFVYKTFALLLLSLVWEATLALPYGWWGYHYPMMMGIVVRPWFDLPLEAVMLWPAAAFMNILLYEGIRICLHRGNRPLLEVLFGTR